jgi:hypothetical protein
MMTAAATGAPITYAAPAAIPPPVAAAPMAASPEEIPAVPRPGTPSVLTANTPAVRPPRAPVAGPTPPGSPGSALRAGEVIVVAQGMMHQRDAGERRDRLGRPGRRQLRRRQERRKRPALT